MPFPSRTQTRHPLCRRPARPGARACSTALRRPEGLCSSRPPRSRLVFSPPPPALSSCLSFPHASSTCPAYHPPPPAWALLLSAQHASAICPACHFPLPHPRPPLPAPPRHRSLRGPSAMPPLPPSLCLPPPLPCALPSSSPARGWPLRSQAL